MKKGLIYLLFVALVFALTTFSLPKTLQAAQTVASTAKVSKVQSIAGVKKLKRDTVKAVILGDSIAVSQGVSNPLIDGWNKVLSDSLDKRYSHEIEWDNKALSGTIVDYSIERAKEIDSSTDVVFICVGRNDRNFYTPKQFSQKYSYLIHIIKNKAPKADVFCVVEPPMVTKDDSLFLGIRKAIIDISAKTGSNLIDVWSAFPKKQSALDTFLTDGLHPNEKGYILMSNYMYNRLVKVINTTRRIIVTN